MDCRLYDEGTSARHNDSMWSNWNNSAIIKREADYTSIKKANNDTASSWQISNAPFTNDELTVEFDVYVDGSDSTVLNGFAQIRNQSYNVIGSIGLYSMGLPLNQWHHIIFQFKTDYVYISNTTNTNTTNRSLSQEVNKFMLRCDTSASETRYKNFKVY